MTNPGPLCRNLSLNAIVDQIAYLTFIDHVSGLVQERRKSIANTLELHLSCTNPWMCPDRRQEHQWYRKDEWVIEWVIKFNSLSRTADNEVNVVHISHAIIGRMTGKGSCNRMLCLETYPHTLMATHFQLFESQWYSKIAYHVLRQP